jgi:hypothetical protein
MDNKIGCFGSVLYHEPGSARCSACPLQAECKVEVDANEAKMQKWFTALRDNASATRKVGRRGVAAIHAPEASPRVVATITSSAPLLNSGKKLPKKPQQFVDNWCKKGIEFDAYQRGVNPFEGCGNKFAGVAMGVFMRGGTDGTPGCATKDDLIDAFTVECKWLLGTASSHANIVFDAFEYLGIISVHGQRGYLIDHSAKEKNE